MWFHRDNDHIFLILDYSIFTVPYPEFKIVSMDFEVSLITIIIPHNKLIGYLPFVVLDGIYW